MSGSLEKLKIARDKRKRLPKVGVLKNVNDPRWIRLREMEERGEISIGTRSLPESFWRMKGSSAPTSSVRQALAEDREEGY